MRVPEFPSVRCGPAGPHHPAAEILGEFSARKGLTDHNRLRLLRGDGGGNKPAYQQSDGYYSPADRPAGVGFLRDRTWAQAAVTVWVERGHCPEWNAFKDVLVHPPNALTARLELIHRLCGRRPVGLSEREDECEVLYFPSTHEHRMFGVFETFFLFADPDNERRIRALVWEAVHYRPETQQLAERALHAAPLAGQRFSAMHIRRGDFQYKTTRADAVEVCGSADWPRFFRSRIG